MTFPRSPASAAANSSLGAVGGARGTAAGAIRVLVEFLTQYDSKAVKQLESDLKDLSTQEDAAGQRQISALRALETSKKRQVAAEKELQKLISTTANNPRTVRSNIAEIQRAGALSKFGKQKLAALDAELGANGRLATLVTKIANLERGRVGQTKLAVNAEKDRLAAMEQQQAVQGQLGRFQALKQNVIPKIGGLALGALGGIFGGALIGVGFAAAQAVLDATEQALLDIVDSGRHARDAIKEVGDSINQLADSADFGGDRVKAAAQYLKDLGIAADDATVAVLAKAAADANGTKFVDEYIKISQIKEHSDATEKENVKRLTNQLIEEAKTRGDLHTIRREFRGSSFETADAAYYEKQALELLGISAEALSNKLASADAAQRQLAGSAQLAAFAEQQLIGAIQRTAGLKLAGFDARIEGLQSAGGESARTRAIQAKIDALQNSGGNSRQKNTELANIAEERALILLRQRLRLMGTNINLEKYSGKFLLEAIQAKLNALQKEAAAQDRLNKLLTLQYNMSQTLQRNQGESIRDFLERRAQQNRDYLSQQRDIERQTVEARLQELQAKTQDEVALQDLAERRKNALAQGGADNRIKNLQKELAASRKADAAALAAKIKAVQKQKEAYAQSAKDAEHYATVAANAQIAAAINASNTITDLSKLTGEITGLSAARSFLLGLLASGALSPEEVARMREAISRIDATLRQYEAKQERLGPKKDPRDLRFAKGGVIPLNNASSPFGQNYRFGEQGTEAAVVLQHKIASQIKGSGVEQVGPFYMERGDDWLRDRYNIKEVVKQAVEEALR